MNTQPNTFAFAYLQNDIAAKKSATELSKNVGTPLVEITTKEPVAELAPTFSLMWRRWKEEVGYGEGLSSATLCKLRSLKGVNFIHVVKSAQTKEGASAIEAFSAAAARLGIAVE